MQKKNPTRRSDLGTTVHSDDSVSYWDVLRQQWRRRPADMIEDEVLATLPDAERTRIARAAGEVA